MRKTIAVVAGLLIMAGWTVTAQEKAKPDKEEPKAKSGHETMAKSDGGRSATAKIARAMSAAPPSISTNATIMEVTADGQMKQLRAGTNGWMCMTEADGTPMCLDKEWQSWADGWVNKKDPQVKNIGLAYMLKGDNGASNTDPYAKKATPDQSVGRERPARDGHRARSDAARRVADRSAERRTVGDVEGYEIRSHHDADRADAKTGREGFRSQACREEVALHGGAGGGGDGLRRRQATTFSVFA